MLDPDPKKRPDVNAILSTDKIKKILARRKMVRPFNKIVSDATPFADLIVYVMVLFFFVEDEGDEKCMELNVYISDIPLQFAHLNYVCIEVDTEARSSEGFHCTNVNTSNSGGRIVGRLVPAIGRFEHRF